MPAVKTHPPVKTLLRRGDSVRVITGREGGKEGKVLRILSKKGTIVIDQVNLLKKHAKPTQKNPQGGILERPGAISISNVMIVCGGCNRPTRIGVKLLADGKKLRVCKRCDEVLTHEKR